MDHGYERRDGHETALRAVQRPAAKPWRGVGAAGGAALPVPPKLYLVEPRDFRELVQRLTGAGTAAAPAHAVAPHGRREPAAAEQFDYASWFSAPLLSPASLPAGLDGHHGNGALI